jgi:hypothetical protein
MIIAMRSARRQKSSFDPLSPNGGLQGFRNLDSDTFPSGLIRYEFAKGVMSSLKSKIIIKSLEITHALQSKTRVEQN